MTDRYAGFLVILGADVREDDCEPIITALRMVRGVVDVEAVPASVDLHIAQVRIDAQWRERLLALLRNPDAFAQPPRKQRS